MQIIIDRIECIYFATVKVIMISKQHNYDNSIAITGCKVYCRIRLITIFMWSWVYLLLFFKTKVRNNERKGWGSEKEDGEEDTINSRRKPDARSRKLAAISTYISSYLFFSTRPTLVATICMHHEIYCLLHFSNLCANTMRFA